MIRIIDGNYFINECNLDRMSACLEPAKVKAGANFIQHYLYGVSVIVAAIFRMVNYYFGDRNWYNSESARQIIFSYVRLDDATENKYDALLFNKVNALYKEICSRSGQPGLPNPSLKRVDILDALECVSQENFRKTLEDMINDSEPASKVKSKKSSTCRYKEKLEKRIREISEDPTKEKIVTTKEIADNQVLWDKIGVILSKLHPISLIEIESRGLDDSFRRLVVDEATLQKRVQLLKRIRRDDLIPDELKDPFTKELLEEPVALKSIKNSNTYISWIGRKSLDAAAKAVIGSFGNDATQLRKERSDGKHRVMHPRTNEMVWPDDASVGNPALTAEKEKIIKAIEDKKQGMQGNNLMIKEKIKRTLASLDVT
ncbi:MAG: hypothetical protein P4L16_01615 [Chlamydiales bacterium]|nr:hypothetical protein [Chlamydiales bacterium]